ncbi:hypothetical protein [Mariniluteicoccus flavus]
MIEALQQFTQSLPPALQWLGILLVSAIPLVESHFGAMLGVVGGIPIPLAVLLAAVGNLASVALVVALASRVRARVVAGKEPTRRQERVRRAFDRWGLIPVCLVGQMVVPNQITAPTLVSIGADPGRVMRWQAAGVALWALVFAGLAAAGVNLLGTVR